MELKTLILGLLMSTAAFAVKAGGGLAYLFSQVPGKREKTIASFGFIAMYGLVFLLVAGILTRIDLTLHVDFLQSFFKSGMILHFLLALLLAAWGIHLLIKSGKATQASKGWIPLVVPCPVCFSVILLSCSFVSALYPDSFLVFGGLYIGFVLISLVMAFLFGLVIQNPDPQKARDQAAPFLGTLMLYISGYFMLSVLIIPQFADLERIYHLSMVEHSVGISKNQFIVLLICLAALVSGGVSGVTQLSKRE